MEKLVRGVHHFQTTTFSAHRELFESLSQGQQPETLLITCSDSRIAPDLLMQTQPGDLFVLRNAGALVPPYGAANGGEGAARSRIARRHAAGRRMAQTCRRDATCIGRMLPRPERRRSAQRGDQGERAGSTRQPAHISEGRGAYGERRADVARMDL